MARTRPEQQRSRTSRQRADDDRRERAVEAARGRRRVWPARVLGPDRDSGIGEAALGTGIYVVLAAIFLGLALAGGGAATVVWAYLLAAVWLGVAVNRLRKYLRVKRTVDQEVARRLRSDQR